MHISRRAVIILAYILVFWVMLPISLVLAARWLDGALPWTISPTPWGWAIAAAGALLLGSGITMLFVEGKGWPITALPPPRLARSGPYRWMRHPIYVGAWGLVCGLSAALGSPAGVLVLGPGFLAGWVTYARLEERGLLRRFGPDYRRYQAAVGLLPRVPWRWGVQLGLGLGWPLSRRGPRLASGPVVVVANHACYLDPFFLIATARRRLSFLTTAEAFRGRWLARLLRWAGMIPLRRYRDDRTAVRELLAALSAGEAVGIFVETERSWTGAYQGCVDKVARLLARLPVDVVPVGLTGSFACGPRFAERLRRGPVQVHWGAPLRVHGLDPAAVKTRIDDAIRALVDEDRQQQVSLDANDQARLGRVVWACPGCGASAEAAGPSWPCPGCGRPATLGPGDTLAAACAASHATAAVDAHGLTVEGVHIFEECAAGIAPLTPRGRGGLRLGPTGLELGDRHLALSDVRSVTTERADTLQLGLRRGRMVQARFPDPAVGSVWRVQRAIEHARQMAGPAGPDVPTRETEHGR